MCVARGKTLEPKRSADADQGVVELTQALPFAEAKSGPTAHGRVRTMRSAWDMARKWSGFLPQNLLIKEEWELLEACEAQLRRAVRARQERHRPEKQEEPELGIRIRTSK
jgi:hypothetical protein